MPVSQPPVTVRKLQFYTFRVAFLLPSRLPFGVLPALKHFKGNPFKKSRQVNISYKKIVNLGIIEMLMNKEKKTISIEITSKGFGAKTRDILQHPNIARDLKKARGSKLVKNLRRQSA
jgi:hypothetical protein